MSSIARVSLRALFRVCVTELLHCLEVSLLRHFSLDTKILINV